MVMTSQPYGALTLMQRLIDWPYSTSQAPGLRRIIHDTSSMTSQPCRNHTRLVKHQDLDASYMTQAA